MVCEQSATFMGPNYENPGKFLEELGWGARSCHCSLHPPRRPARTALAEGRLCTLLLSHSLTTLPRFPYAHIARTRAKALSSM